MGLHPASYARKEEGGFSGRLGELRIGAASPPRGRFDMKEKCNYCGAKNARPAVFEMRFFCDRFCYEKYKENRGPAPPPKEVRL